MNIRQKLVKAMGAMTNPRKSKTAKVVHKNGGSHTYEYATLDEVLDGVKPALKDNELALLQHVSVEDGVLWLDTEVFDEDEKLLLDRVPYQPTGDIQARGSYDTYMRRYRLMMVFGLAGEDDDGQGAKKAPAEAEPIRKVVQHDYSQMDALVSRYESCYGIDTKEAKRSIVSRFGNPKDMDEDGYEAFLRDLDYELRGIEQQQRNVVTQEDFAAMIGGSNGS